MTALSSTFGILTPSLTNAERIQVLTKLAPWAVRCGRNCRPLMTIYYEDYLNESIDVARAKFLFEKAPVL
jgi:ubiquinone biosynthesis protein Coq4